MGKNMGSRDAALMMELRARTRWSGGSGNGVMRGGMEWQRPAWRNAGRSGGDLPDKAEWSGKHLPSGMRDGVARTCLA